MIELSQVSERVKICNSFNIAPDIQKLLIANRLIECGRLKQCQLQGPSVAFAHRYLEKAQKCAITLCVVPYNECLVTRKKGH